MVRSMKWAALVAALTLLVAGCSNAPQDQDDEFNASNVECEDVSDALSSAKSELNDLEADAEDRAGTPGEADAEASVALVSEKVDALERRSESSACAAPDDPEPTPTPTPTVPTCPAEFVQVELGHEFGRVDALFQEKFATATANATNLEVALNNLLLQVAGSNASALAIWASALGLHEDPNNWAGLVEDGCLSQEGQVLWYQFEGALTAKGTTVTVGEAPSNGTNSGVDSNGTFGVAEQPGVNGDRKAIYIELRDGSSVWIMVRCGNVVYLIPPPMLSKVPTDDPGPQGNAPEGSGLNLDPGPGTYIPPQDMEQPPAAPYVAPAAPAPDPVVPPVGSTPDPVTAPPLQPGGDQAPPDAPADGTSCPTGVPTC